MWTPATRREHSRDHLRYGSDLTDAEWEIIAPFMPPPAKTGRPREWSMREIMSAIFYVLRAGCAWRMLIAVGTLIAERPPHRTVRAGFPHTAPTSGDGRRSLAAGRMRSSACDASTRRCVRNALCWFAFPSAPALGSAGSSAGRPASFVGLSATMAGSDFSCPFIVGYGSSPSRRDPATQRAPRMGRRSPGSRARNLSTCQGL